MQSAATLNVGDSRRLRGYEPIRQADFPAERDPIWLLYQQGVRSRVDGEAINVLAEDHAAGPAGLLEHNERDTAPMQLVRRREPRDASADDSNVYQSFGGTTPARSPPGHHARR